MNLYDRLTDEARAKLEEMKDSSPNAYKGLKHGLENHNEFNKFNHIDVRTALVFLSPVGWELDNKMTVELNALLK